jgi:hypothetical protein
MTILKAMKRDETVSINAKFPKSLKEEIHDYCILAGIEAMQDFLTQSAEYILLRDKDWIKYKKDHNLDY